MGYNTTANVSHEVKQGAEEQEAKWNYAFWLQNQELVFGVDETQQMVKDWIEKSGFCYYSSDELFGGETEPDEESYEGITEAFVQVLVEIVQELHSSGFIQKQFGREIPVLIHELEYYDEIAEQNIKANSIELVEEFVAFCKGEY